MKKGLLKVAFFGMLMGGIFTLTSCHESSSYSMPETEPTEITVTAPTTYSIIGSIATPDGTVPTGVKITIKDANGNVVGTATPDAQGNYTVTGLPQGTYTVEVSGANIETTATTVTVGEGAQVQVAAITVIEKSADVAIDATNASEQDLTNEVSITDNATEGTTVADATVNIGISAPAGLLSADQQQQYENTQIAVTPFYNESEVTATRAYSSSYGNTDALYYGVWVHFANGRNAPEGFTLAQPLTITFDVVDASVANYMGVYYWNEQGQKQMITNNDNMSYTISGKTITLNTKKLFHFGLFFRLNQSTSNTTESLAITRNKTVEGPTSDPIIGFNYKAGASMTSQSTNTATAAQKSFLKNWIVRNYGRAQVYTLPGSYQLNINIPSTMYITTYATQQVDRQDIRAFDEAARFVRNTYGSYNVTYTGHQKSSHSGGASSY